MAHKKGVGSSKNGRESASQRLGVKIWGGQKIIAGNIIVRQRGNKHYAGENVAQGKTIRFMHLLMVWYTSTKASSTRALYQFSLPKPTQKKQRLKLK